VSGYKLCDVVEEFFIFLIVDWNLCGLLRVLVGGVGAVRIR
jgi:hypothetical protein